MKLNWHKINGGFWASIGFLLSPLSWWNDAFVNLPLAVGFGWLISQFYPPAYEFGVVLGYWLTNVAGFVLMHKGLRAMMLEPEKAVVRCELGKDMLISMVYTGLIVVLLKLKIIPSLN